MATTIVKLNKSLNRIIVIGPSAELEYNMPLNMFSPVINRTGHEIIFDFFSEKDFRISLDTIQDPNAEPDTAFSDIEDAIQYVLSLLP